MNVQLTEKTLLDMIGKDPTRQPSQKRIAFDAVRTEIVTKLLTYSYLAIGVQLPAEDTIRLRAEIIADKAGISTFNMKQAFELAIRNKVTKDLRTPITFGDLENAISDYCKNRNSTYYGKESRKLPSLKDKELWSENVARYAINFEREELERLKATEMPQVGYNG